MSKCQICQHQGLELLIDCGEQALCNRFLRDSREEEYKFPLKLVQCENCGTLQLKEIVPVEEVAPRYEWLQYREPEEHLDELADVIFQLPNISPKSTICGVSSKDDTLLKRLKRKGIASTWRVDPQKDLGIHHPGAGGEMVQKYFTCQKASEIKKSRGVADVVIARHIYEHSSDVQETVSALKNLIHDDGYIILEIPDCTETLKSRDYTMLWEEHTLYFTPATFKNSFSFFGLSDCWSKSFPYPVENAIVAILQKKDHIEDRGRLNLDIEDEFTLARDYAQEFLSKRNEVQQVIKRYRDNDERIALFGAGHLACIYSNIMEISPYLDCVIDDNPHKKGLLMPGSKLMISGSDQLTARKINKCLLSVRPDVQEKVIEKNKDFIASGGEFISIYRSGINPI